MKNLTIARDKVDPTTYIGREGSPDRKCYIGLVNDELNAHARTSWFWRENPELGFTGLITADAIWIVSVSHACFKRDEQAAKRLFREKGIELNFVNSLSSGHMQAEFDEMVESVAVAAGAAV